VIQLAEPGEPSGLAFPSHLLALSGTPSLHISWGQHAVVCHLRFIVVPVSSTSLGLSS
jgi:hypothetical protein